MLHRPVLALSERPSREVLHPLILDICRLRDWTTAKELARWFSMHQRSLVHRHLGPMVDDGSTGTPVPGQPAESPAGVSHAASWIAGDTLRAQKTAGADLPEQPLATPQRRTDPLFSAAFSFCWPEREDCALDVRRARALGRFLGETLQIACGSVQDALLLGTQENLGRFPVELVTIEA